MANFTGKHLCHSLFLIKLQDDACNFTRKETPTLMVSSEFFEIFKNSFFKEHPLATAAGKPNHLKEWPVILDLFCLTFHLSFVLFTFDIIYRNTKFGKT